MTFTIPMAAFRMCVVSVAANIDDDLSTQWSRELLAAIEWASAETLLTQDDVWTYAHQAFPAVPDFGTPLRNRIVDVMERLADAIYSDPDVVISGRH
ncbi:MAG: hypothetical protein ACOYLC_07915 [Armatimonadaceae bacterium]